MNAVGCSGHMIIPNFSAYGQVPTWSHFDIEKGRIAWTNVAKAISEFEKVKMIVHPDNVENAKKLLNPENRNN